MWWIEHHHQEILWILMHKIFMLKALQLQSDSFCCADHIAIWLSPGDADTHFCCLMHREAGHKDLAQRLIALQYELTDRLTFYLCGRKPSKYTVCYRGHDFRIVTSHWFRTCVYILEIFCNVFFSYAIYWCIYYTVWPGLECSDCLLCIACHSMQAILRTMPVGVYNS